MGWSCEPPRSDPHPPGGRWTCSHCGQVWELRDVRDTYDFTDEKQITVGTWAPVEDASDTQHAHIEVPLDLKDVEIVGRELDEFIAAEGARTFNESQPGWVWRQVTKDSPQAGIHTVVFAPGRSTR